MSSGVLVRILTKDKNILNLVADQGLGSPYIIAKSCLTGLKTVNKVALRGKKELETISKPKNKYRNGTESVHYKEFQHRLTFLGETKILARCLMTLKHKKSVFLIDFSKDSGQKNDKTEQQPVVEVKNPAQSGFKKPSFHSANTDRLGEKLKRVRNRGSN